MPPKRNLPPPKPPTTGRRAIPQDQTQQSTHSTPSATTTTATPAPSSVGSSFPALSALPPSRLDSLSRPRALSASPGSSGSPGGSSSLGLKFKPKLVARRPKEEREAAAPTVAPPILPAEPSSRGRGRGGRGGFGARGGRGGGAGRGKMEPVSSIASGPFADPVFGDPRASRAAAFERRAPAEYAGTSSSGSSERSIGLIAALAAKERKGTPEAKAGLAGVGSGAGGSTAQADDYESDDEAVRQGFERINIAKVGKLTNEDAQGYARYFPIREDSGSANAEDDHANDEQIDDALVQEREQSEFVDVFGEWDLSQLERKLYFFQFAPVLPVVSGVKADNAVKDENEQSADSATSSSSTGKAKAAKAKPAAASGIGAQAAEGQVGKLVVRKSGKISIVYGGIEMDIAKGARTQFLQDVVVVDDTPEAEQATLLGQITGKVVVTPSIEKLLESDGDESD